MEIDNFFKLTNPLFTYLLYMEWRDNKKSYGCMYPRNKPDQALYCQLIHSNLQNFKNVFTN